MFWIYFTGSILAFILLIAGIIKLDNKYQPDMKTVFKIGSIIFILASVICGSLVISAILSCKVNIK